MLGAQLGRDSLYLQIVLVLDNKLRRDDVLMPAHGTLGDEAEIVGHFDEADGRLGGLRLL